MTRNQVRMREASEPEWRKKAEVDLGGSALSASFSRAGQGTLRRLWRRRSKHHPSIMVCTNVGIKSKGVLRVSGRPSLEPVAGRHFIDRTVALKSCSKHSL